MAQTQSAFGMIFAIVAGYFLYVAISMEVVVYSGDAPPGFDGVANLQLMHVQTVNLNIGIGAAIVAAIFFVGAAIVSVIEAKRPPVD